MDGRTEGDATREATIPTCPTESQRRTWRWSSAQRDPGSAWVGLQAARPCLHFHADHHALPSRCNSNNATKTNVVVSIHSKICTPFLHFLTSIHPSIILLFSHLFSFGVPQRDDDNPSVLLSLLFGLIHSMLEFRMQCYYYFF